MPNTKNMSLSAMPQDIIHHQKTRSLEIKFSTDEVYTLSCEYLRVFSPSAEVKGHGPGDEVLQVGKKTVNIGQIEPVGNYAVRLIFTDGHDTGIFSWDYLRSLGREFEQNWADYLQRLAAAGASRDN